MRTSRQDLRRRLFQLAVTQGGYFTAAQAREIGYSYQAQHYHAQHGNWVRVDRGLYRLFAWPVGAHDELVRWTLWAGGRAVVSHESALDVHGIGEFYPARVHLTAPRAFSKRAVGAVIHTADLDRADIEDREGFRVTRPVRSLVDVAAAGADSDQLGRAIEEARDIGLLTPRRLRERAEAVDLKAALRIEQALGRLGL